MITAEQIPVVIGHTAYDNSHKKIGTIENVYLDDLTGRPEWLMIRTGLFGTKETFVPITTAEVLGEEVIVPFAKDQIKGAPNIDVGAGEHLPGEEEARVYDYYGIRHEQPGTGGMNTAMGTAGGESTQDRAADDAMTLSEERLRVSTESHEAGRVRLRKYVVTEEQQVTVPVRREEARLEREPITEANRDRAMGGPEITEAEHEVTLYEEQPVVTTETKPVERVRLSKETVTEEKTVVGQVRKERIETEGAGLMDDEQ